MKRFVRSCFLIAVVYAVEAWAEDPVFGVGLQTFNWTDLRDRPTLFRLLSHRVDEFAKAGFTHVWLPPYTQSLDWQGYVPNQWYKIVEAQTFKAMNTKLVQLGVKPVCEVVVNHRSAEHVSSCNGEYIAFQNPTWNTSAVVSDDWKCADHDCTTFCSGACTCGSADTGQNFYSVPDLDHTNPLVQADIKEFMRWMQKNYLCKGWRFDMAKGYHASFAKDYRRSTENPFAVGEYYHTRTEPIAAWAASSGMLAFDMTLRPMLRKAFETENYTLLGPKGGSPPGVSGQDMSAASTFLDNHDTTNVDGVAFDGGFPPKHLVLGYVYILTHPSFPWVFRPHFDGANRDVIRQLIAIRDEAKVTPDDTLFISASAADLYASYIGEAGASGACEGKLAVKLGRAAWKPCGEGWILAAYDIGWAVWKRAVVVLFA